MDIIETGKDLIGKAFKMRFPEGSLTLEDDKLLYRFIDATTKEEYCVRVGMFILQIFNRTKGYIESFNFMQSVGEMITYVRFDICETDLDITHIRSVRNFQNEITLLGEVGTVTMPEKFATETIVNWPYPFIQDDFASSIRQLMYAGCTDFANHYVEYHEGGKLSELPQLIDEEKDILHHILKENKTR